MNRPDKLFNFIGESIEDDIDFTDLDAELTKRFGETCAALVMDSTGFTRSTKALGPAFFLAIIYRLREVCFEIAGRYGAIDSRAHADNFYAEFKNVDDAVEAAFAVHRHFEDNPVPLVSGNDRFGVCVGIGFGRVLRSDHEGVYGNEMNYASKLGEDVAERGETLLTKAAFEALSNPETFETTITRIKVSGVEMPIYSIKSGAGREE